MLSRRTLFEGLALAVLPVVAAKAAVKAEPTKTPKGTIRHVPSLNHNHNFDHTHSFTHTHGFSADHTHSFTPAHARFDIWDGSKFVDLQSEAGQRVVAEL